MVPIVTKVLFPPDLNDPECTVNQVLLTLALFGVGFLMRPVEGYRVGHALRP